MNFLQQFFGHFTTITRHKLKVTCLCFKMGLYKQGLLHDLSKYSWIEFRCGVQYYQGNRSPIDAEKEDIGYSMGWLHHKGRNPHHWEYWIDRTWGKIVFIEMPKKYIKESVCDRIAACQTYQGKNYTNSSAYDYFMQGSDRILMNPVSAQLLENYLKLVKDKGLEEAFRLIKLDK